MENLLALDIHDDCVSGVLLEFGQKITVVRSYGLASLRASSLAEAVAAVIERTGHTQGECRVAIGTERFFFRNLVLPFVDDRKVAKVLPFELEELTSSRIDELHLAYISSNGNHEGTDIVAGMLDKGYLTKTLAELGSVGQDPEIVAVSGLQTAAALVAMNPATPTFVVLDISFKQTTLILVDKGRIALVRSLGLDAETLAGFSLSLADARVEASAPGRIPEIVQRLILPVQQTLLSVGRSYLFEEHAPCFINGAVGLYQDLYEQLGKELELEVRPCNIAGRPLLKVEPVEHLPWNPAIMNRALALGLWKRRDCPILNFRGGPFRKRTSLKKLRKNLAVVAAPLGLICLGLVGFFWWEYSGLAKQRDGMSAEIAAIFQETLPEVNRIVNPVQQLQVKIDESRKLYHAGGGGRGGNHQLDLLAELSSRIPQTLPIRISRLVADQNDVRISAETSDFNVVDNVKRELEKSAYFSSVVISSANLAPKGGEVRFELRLELR